MLTNVFPQSFTLKRLGLKPSVLAQCRWGPLVTVFTSVFEDNVPKSVTTVLLLPIRLFITNVKTTARARRPSVGTRRNPVRGGRLMDSALSARRLPAGRSGGQKNGHYRGRQVPSRVAAAAPAPPPGRRAAVRFAIKRCYWSAGLLNGATAATPPGAADVDITKQLGS
ncbi:hypothetical protein EVAR_64360_1 [Eumeta japonica]|uniref:Uncharacterized protein n=1 Tax=Eumeta variegata TaxID=151549 RepID=A0A4C1ZM24_EUMVA|nr:hypothetical protein EVAR_64360_1 [Eumeta japonica]